MIVTVVRLGRGYEASIVGRSRRSEGFAEREAFELRVGGESWRGAAGSLDDDMNVAIFCEGRQIEKIGQ
jgi:ribosome modulation factor